MTETGKIFNLGANGLLKLPVGNDAKAALWNKMEQDGKEQRRRAEYKNSGVGKRFLDKTLGDFTTDTDERREALEKVRAYIDGLNAGSDTNLWLCGASGCGKSFLASMIVRECGGRYRRMYEISDEYSDAGSYSAKTSREELTAMYAKYRVLVIDEVGRLGGQFDNEVLFRVLNARYEEQRPTVIVSNKTKRELGEYLGKAIVDRFAENSTSFEFGGKSYRLSNPDISA